MKTRLKTALWLLLAGAVLAGVMASCGTKNAKTDDKVTLKVINYHVGTDFAAPYFDYLFTEFVKTEAGKNVVFDFEEIPTTDAFNQKIKLLISSGDLPDIVLTGGNNFVEMAARAGKIADLSSYFDNDPEWKGLFDPASLDYNSVGGKIYAVPTQKEVTFLYYNKELFQKAGITPPAVAWETWEEFFAVCEAFKAKGIIPIGMDTADFGWLSNLWFSALIGTGSDAGNAWMNTFHPRNYNTPELVAAAETLQRMLANYTTADAIGGNYDPMATHFFNGEVAMFPNGPWMIPDFKNEEKAPAGFYEKVGVMLMPKYGMSMVPSPGDMIGAKDPKKIDAAAAFLKFETTLDNQIKALEMTGLQPESPKVVIPDSIKRNDPLMALVLDLQTRARITYGQNQIYWYQNTLDAFSLQLPELANRKLSPAAFCAKLTDAAERNED
ncbi:MAG: extracellular solute-binding protein [Treponema sp.]|jgi:raffinose/stachyose/melibiose transport system substrate-binding protein|nr:extracellular solute-binding protein [Treponema sp.]